MASFCRDLNSEFPMDVWGFDAACVEAGRTISIGQVLEVLRKFGKYDVLLGEVLGQVKIFRYLGIWVAIDGGTNRRWLRGRAVLDCDATAGRAVLCDVG